MDHMHLSCFKNLQIILTSLRNNKSTAGPFQCLRHAFFSTKLGDEEGICLAILVLYHSWLNPATAGSPRKEESHVFQVYKA